VATCPADRAAEVDDLPPDFLAILGPLVTRRAEQSLSCRVRGALEQAGGNKTRAARALGVSRQHLYRLLKRLAG
jgi:transcriptional regulator of acetoin/glycerol metabolism